jgi:hypothetical protein
MKAYIGYSRNEQDYHGHVPDYSGIPRMDIGQNRLYKDTRRKNSDYIFISSVFRKRCQNVAKRYGAFLHKQSCPNFTLFSCSVRCSRSDWVHVFFALSSCFFRTHFRKFHTGFTFFSHRFHTSFTFISGNFTRTSHTFTLISWYFCRFLPVFGAYCFFWQKKALFDRIGQALSMTIYDYR